MSLCFGVFSSDEDGDVKSECVRRYRTQVGVQRRDETNQNKTNKTSSSSGGSTFYTHVRSDNLFYLPRTQHVKRTQFIVQCVYLCVYSFIQSLHCTYMRCKERDRMIETERESLFCLCVFIEQNKKRQSVRNGIQEHGSVNC